MVNTSEFSLILYVLLNPHKTLYVTYTWILKYHTNEPTCEPETESDIESRLVITVGKVGGGRVDERLEFADVRYLHIWINKVLLYSLLPNILHYGLSPDIEYSPLCCRSSE